MVSGGDRLVLVDEAAQPIATEDPVGTGPGPSGLPAGQGCPQLERAVWPGGVVVGNVLLQHLLQMAPPEDEHPIQALAAHSSHPALGNRVRARRLGGCPHDAHAFGPEHRVEGGRELGIPVVDQQGRAPALVLKLPGQLPSLLGDSGGGWVLRAAGHEHPPRVELDEEQHEQRLQPERLDREEVTGEHPLGVGAEEPAPG